ncbi:Glycerol-3-phosphate O-acyltransferase 2 [Hypsizygus marmoreus]|uniref:Glycerol-3-phosphate O-acyltransferase 2 n=1 Tax=Hypsizygus marmoreus TaxID=39966 RepID=A0A369J427_HYPMA|nr:Glycerol-3-phosphate O-acyltransferase 2 [Hypsizygus marmoreus]
MPSDPKVLHRLLRQISDWALSSFFTEIRVIGGENVPKDGPIIVTATHHNMMLDPAILSVTFPHGRMLNYWSKASLFVNPIVSYILFSSGNIPVDRKSKDRQVLFQGTFEALSRGQAVALFPEGTSYTEPRIMQVKDGAAWASLEYVKWVKEHPGAAPDQDVVIVPAAIVYTNKSKYRSSVVVEFGQPITLDPYKEQFFSDVEGAPRAAVKRLTRTIEGELVKATVNAPDWDTLYAARITRDLLWEDNKTINLDEFVAISQTLVDLFSTPNASPNFNSVRRNLLEYYSLLQSSNLTNTVLSSLPLPRSLDPNTPATVPSRLFTLLILIRDSIFALIRLPFFLFPLIVHAPVYAMGRVGARLVKDEEETQAQNKVVFGLLASMLIYPAAFFFLWALFWYTSAGALLAAVILYMFATYHNRLIDANYERAKRIMAAWRVLVGVWAPKRWDLSLAALSQYTTPSIPKESPWIDKPKTTAEGPRTSPPESSSPAAPSVAHIPGLSNVIITEEPPVKARPKRRPPSRRIVRHVLRARIEAVKALAGFFDYLDRTPQATRVNASMHLARVYGHLDPPDPSTPDAEAVSWRDVHEVIQFLKKRGAKIPTLKQGAIDGEWAALSSEAEGEGDSTVDDGEPIWVPRSEDN